MSIDLRALLAASAVGALMSGQALADCPAVTVADPMGVAAGKYPQQYELAEFEAAANCKLSFAENQKIAELNAEIQGNPELPPLAERLPEEPLVVAPYDEIGTYGGTLDGLSNANEAGTSDLLSFRHVNLVRYADNLTTIVPNIAKDWKWNDDFTELTFYLRKGHKWSDGAPFTSADVKFWYDDLNFDENVIAKPKDFLLVAGERMQVETPDDTTVVFKLPAPKPGLLAHFATSYAQGFQPQHFLGQFHPKHNPDADKLAQELGFANGYEVINYYYGQSDWTDTPSPFLRDADRAKTLPKGTVPTLESHILVNEGTESRQLVANPYFHMVDTAGNQLPYINRMDELFINENEVRVLKIVNAEIDYKAQSLQLPSAPIMLEGQEKGDYTIDLRPTIAMPVVGFNVTHPDEAKRAVFSDQRFRQAMSVAIDRVELNEAAFFGLGVPQQYVGFSPAPAFVPEELKSHMTEYNPDMANKLLDEIGMKDVDGDGFRELPNGDKLAININFATQGLAAEVVEFIAQTWTEVGIQTSSKEVTPDEYRSAQSSNQLDVISWQKGQPLAIVLGNNELWVPPFENYFGSRNGMAWAEYIDSNGNSGQKPPAWVDQMIADINKFQTLQPGSDEFNEIGARMAQTMAEQLLFIGTVSAPNPIFHRNALKNFPDFKTWSYEYYRTYPYRPQQWFLADEAN